MEKLIELLNEYKKIKWYDWNTKITNYDTDTGSFTNGYSWLEYEIVIGKRYGFIKWLVENNKIELDAWPLYWCQLIMYNRQPYTLYETILMLLAIEERPIELLISILK